MKRGEIYMSMCDIHNQERVWIYQTDEFKTYIERVKYECTECNRILMKHFGVEMKPFGR